MRDIRNDFGLTAAYSVGRTQLKLLDNVSRIFYQLSQCDVRSVVANGPLAEIAFNNREILATVDHYTM